MPQLDHNTMDWLTGVIAPLLAALVSAAVGGVAALYGVRSEAARAEKRARAAEARAEERALAAEVRVDQIRELNDTFDTLMATLYVIANAMKPEAQVELRPDPVSINYPLIGDHKAVARYIGLLNDWSKREDHSGFGPEEMSRLGDVEDDLRQAVIRQRDRIRAGKGPLLPPVGEELEDLVRGLNQL